MVPRMRHNTAFTHRCQGQKRPSPVEVFVLIAIVAIFAATLLPPALQAAGRGRTSCANNLKQLLKAFHTYRYDHDGCTPPIQWLLEGEDEKGNPKKVTAYYPWPQYLFGNESKPFFKCPEDDGPADLSYDFNRFLRSYFPVCPTGLPFPSFQIVVQPGITPWRLVYRVNLPEKVIVFCDWENQPSNDADGPDCPDDISARRSGWFTYLPSEKNASLRHSGKANYAFWDGHIESLLPEEVGRDSGGGGGSSLAFALSPLFEIGGGSGCVDNTPWMAQVEPWWGPGQPNATVKAGKDSAYNTGSACPNEQSGGANIWDQYGHRMFCAAKTDLGGNRTDTWGKPPQWFWGADPNDPGPGPAGSWFICTVDATHPRGRFPYGAMPTFNLSW